MVSLCRKSNFAVTGCHSQRSFPSVGQWLTSLTWWH